MNILAEIKFSKWVLVSPFNDGVPRYLTTAEVGDMPTRTSIEEFIRDPVWMGIDRDDDDILPVPIIGFGVSINGCVWELKQTKADAIEYVERLSDRVRRDKNLHHFSVLFHQGEMHPGAWKDAFVCGPPGRSNVIICGGISVHQELGMLWYRRHCLACDWIDDKTKLFSEVGVPPGEAVASWFFCPACGETQKINIRI